MGTHGAPGICLAGPLTLKNSEIIYRSKNQLMIAINHFGHNNTRTSMSQWSLHIDTLNDLSARQRKRKNGGAELEGMEGTKSPGHAGDNVGPWYGEWRHTDPQACGRGGREVARWAPDMREGLGKVYRESLK